MVLMSSMELILVGGIKTVESGLTGVDDSVSFPSHKEPLKNHNKTSVVRWFLRFFMSAEKPRRHA
jgi:hypothetical protein